MSNHIGDMVSVTATPVMLSQESVGAYHITVRAGTYNAGTVFFSRSGTVDTGFLEPGDSADFHNINARDIYVRGASGDFVMWHGDSV